MTARDDLLDALTVEQHNNGGWKTPPSHWNADVSTAVMPVETFTDDDVVRARRRKEAFAEWDAAGHEEETA